MILSASRTAVRYAPSSLSIATRFVFQVAEVDLNAASRYLVPVARRVFHYDGISADSWRYADSWSFGSRSRPRCSSPPMGLRSSRHRERRFGAAYRQAVTPLALAPSGMA